MCSVALIFPCRFNDSIKTYKQLPGGPVRQFLGRSRTWRTDTSSFSTLGWKHKDNCNDPSSWNIQSQWHHYTYIVRTADQHISSLNILLMFCWVDRGQTNNWSCNSTLHGQCLVEPKHTSPSKGIMKIWTNAIHSGIVGNSFDPFSFSYARQFQQPVQA